MLLTVDPMRFDVDIRLDYRRNVAHVRPLGELDMLTADDFGAAMDFATRDRARVVLDLSGLSFCDASGLDIIERSARHLAEHGAELVVHSPSDVVVKMMMIFDMTALIVSPEVADAPDSVDPGTESPNRRAHVDVDAGVDRPRPATRGWREQSPAPRCA